MWKFKKDVEVYTEDFWYDLTWGGYLKPEEILENSKGEIIDLLQAIKMVRSFEKAVLAKIEQSEE